MAARHQADAVRDGFVRLSGKRESCGIPPATVDADPLAGRDFVSGVVAQTCQYETLFRTGEVRAAGTKPGIAGVGKGVGKRVAGGEANSEEKGGKLHGNCLPAGPPSRADGRRETRGHWCLAFQSPDVEPGLGHSPAEKPCKPRVFA